MNDDTINRKEAINAIKRRRKERTMSDDLIKRSDAIKAVNREKSDWNCDYNVPIDNCIKRLNKVKSADRPQGEWIFKTVFPNDKSEFPMGYLECPVCGSHHSNSTPCNYCDNCGARLKGADDEDC